MKLKVCPFCGGKARLLKCIPRAVGKGKIMDTSIECEDCFASIGTKHESFEKAAKEWNKRIK